ncbi:hypothetical protein ACJQWK_03749 [Exserohilum turcicum]
MTGWNISRPPPRPTEIVAPSALLAPKPFHWCIGPTIPRIMTFNVQNTTRKTLPPTLLLPISRFTSHGPPPRCDPHLANLCTRSRSRCSTPKPTTAHHTVAQMPARLCVCVCMFVFGAHTHTHRHRYSATRRSCREYGPSGDSINTYKQPGASSVMPPPAASATFGFDAFFAQPVGPRLVCYVCAAANTRPPLALHHCWPGIFLVRVHFSFFGGSLAHST